MHTERLAPNRGASVALQVDGELQRIAPELITPEVLARVWHAQGDASAEARAAEFREVAPGRWERAHVDRTYLRCKQGGSRMTDFRVTWRLEEGKPEASGILAIVVVGAAACEAFNYGGGS